MAGGTAFCTSCGAVVGENWEACEACGARQRTEEPAVTDTAAAPANPVENLAPLPGPVLPPRRSPFAGAGSGTPTATYLTVFGIGFLVAGFIYMVATSGFPPGTTTTYEFHADGTTTTTTSPDVIEVIFNLALFVIGGVLLRASRVARLPRR